ncbi:epoxide hydrolase 4-like [Thrips palmi]|uniref:Epoxide hydrolase 4-like n=1 Tax=Thrips palmi TaxID=161013 RepID=A0A6P9A0R3_THRPL|nr:epoxide hydrolase 4-like [Thrips palmi]
MAWYRLSWRRLLLRVATVAAVWLLSAPLALYFSLVLLVRVAWNPFGGFWRPKPRTQPPPVLQDAALGQHAYVTLSKGIKLHYVHTGDSSRPLMLLLHGFPEFWFSWKHQMQAFSQDYWVVALDMRGYGDSDKPSGSSAYRADALVDDVKELLEAFERPRATLVGHGWGAAVAWMFAERFPEKVDKMVSIGAPHPYVFQQALVFDRKQLMRSWYFFLFQVPFLAELVLQSDDLACLSAALRRGRRDPPAVTDQDLEAYKYAFGQPGALTAPLNYYRAAGWGLPRRWRRRAAPASTVEDAGQDTSADISATTSEDHSEDATDATEDTSADNSHEDAAEETNATKADAATDERAEPERSMPARPTAEAVSSALPDVLVLLGGRDAYVEHSTAFRTRKKFPNVRVVIVRDANHFAHLDDPEAVNKAVRKFLQGSGN